MSQTYLCLLARLVFRLIVLLAGPALMMGCEEQGPRLPAVEARIDQTSVSGISAGAYMAGQFQFAHGDEVIGAAIIAGGPYGCAESFYADMMPGPGAAFLNLSRAMNGCMLNALRHWGIPDAKALAARASQLAAQGRISPIKSVREDRIYLFSGREDRTVVPAIVASAFDFYLEIGVPRERLVFINDITAGHAFVTADSGNRCDVTASPYIVDCDYDQAHALLSHIYGTLAPKARAVAGDLLSFDQREFVSGIRDHGLADAGLVYVPMECRAAAGCRVHIAFHGCGQSIGSIGDAFATRTGLLSWADSNRLIVLFPQVASTPSNPQACWDWWGYTGRDFLTRDGPQIMAVRRMLDRLAAPRPMI